jgi:probable phosphoglycerate mutase
MDALVQLARSEPALPDNTCHNFYFLRHGQTARNAARVFQSRDEPLDGMGQQQVRTAAQRLAQEPIRSVLASDVLRAAQTASTVAHALGHPWQPHVGLRERHFGALIGTSSAQLDWACAPEGGETLNTFVQRSCSALAEALAQPAPVLLVAHGGTLLVLAAWLDVALPPGAMGNAQPLHFTRSGAGWQAQRLLATAGQPSPSNLA